MSETMEKIFAACAAAAVVAFTHTAHAQDDAKFLVDAIRGDIAEVRFGELAEQRGHSQETRKLGRMLTTEHGRAKDKTAELARSYKIAVPTQASAAAQKKYEALTGLSGEAFDRAFISEVIASHRQAIERYMQQAESGADTEVAQLAKETLPTLHEHLAAAESLQSAAFGG